MIWFENFGVLCCYFKPNSFNISQYFAVFRSISFCFVSLIIISLRLNTAKSYDNPFDGFANKGLAEEKGSQREV